jgi:hypothetical protein
MGWPLRFLNISKLKRGTQGHLTAPSCPTQRRQHMLRKRMGNHGQLAPAQGGQH